MGESLVPISQIIPYDHNPRIHSKEQIKLLADHIKQVGFDTPIVVDENMVIIKGHGRLAALKLLKQKEALVKQVVGLSEAQKKAARIADNRIQELAKDHEEYLRVELGELHQLGVDLATIGFDNVRLTELKVDIMSTEPKQSLDEDKEDDVPEVPQNVYGVERGDIWLLGKHRVMCGDSVDQMDVGTLIGDQQISVWLSDPPYGIDHVSVSQEKGQSKGYRKIENDDLADEQFQQFIFDVIKTSLPHMKKGFAFYMWHAMKMQGYVAAAAAAAGILFHRQIVWVKPQFIFGRGHYHWRHELCLMGWLKGDEPNFYGERNQSTIWECVRENDKIHPTQKPIGVLEPSILNHTLPGENVYDPFLGSGSTLIACEKTARTCYGMEIDPHYVSVIIKRWEDYTGQKAQRLN
jgi:site-specific DNA-methyltransferase (adenine-specific)